MAASINRLVEENASSRTVEQNRNPPDVASGVPDPRPGLNVNPTPPFCMPRSAWVSSPRRIPEAQQAQQPSILPPHPHLVDDEGFEVLLPADTLQPNPVLSPPLDYARRHIPPSPPAPFHRRVPAAVPSNPTQYGIQYTVAPQSSTLQSFSQHVGPPTSALPPNARPLVDVEGAAGQTPFVRVLASSSVPGMRRMDQKNLDYNGHGWYEQPPESYLRNSFDQPPPQNNVQHSFGQQPPQNNVHHDFHQQAPQNNVQYSFDQQPPQNTVQQGYNQQPMQSSAQPNFQQFAAAPPRTTEPNLNSPAVAQTNSRQLDPHEFDHDPPNPTRRIQTSSKSAKPEYTTISEFASQENHHIPAWRKHDNLPNDDSASGAKRKREGQIFGSKLDLSRHSPEPFVPASPTMASPVSVPFATSVPPGPVSPPPLGPLPALPAQAKEKSRKPKAPLSKTSSHKAASSKALLSKALSIKKAKSQKSEPLPNTPSRLPPIREQPSPELLRQPKQEALVSPPMSPPSPTNGLIRQSPRKRVCVAPPINLSARDFELIQPRFVRRFLGNFLSLDHPVHTLQFTTSRQAQFKSLIVALAEALAAIIDLQTDLTNPKVQISAIPRLFEAFGSQRIPSDTNCLPFIFGHSIISLLIADDICTHADGFSASSPRITKQHSIVTPSKRKAGLSSHTSSQDNAQHIFPPGDLEDDFIAGTLVLTARLQRSLRRSPLTGDPSLAEPPSYKTFAIATPKNAAPKGLYLYSSDVPTNLLEEFEAPSRPCAKYPLDVSYVRLPLEFANITLWILENKVFNPPPSMI